MKWENRRRSANVDDRRGRVGLAVGGGGTLVVALIVLLLGGDPREILQGVLSQSDSATVGTTGTSPEEDRLADMCSVVLADTEDTWHDLFGRMDREYIEPKLVIYSGNVETACGRAGASAGPFYCPGDQSVYIDLSFYQDLSSDFGAPGDFAQAYVIAHVVGHHVQNLLGVLGKTQALMARSSPTEANELSVAMELQADFYAGIWAHYADRSRGLLESGDLQEALNAASQIGDDRIQERLQGYVVPESFTHGTAAQRYASFKLGYDTGDLTAFKL